MIQTFLRRSFMRALEDRSAESAIGFGERLQRRDSTGLCSSGVVFDPHRPYQNFQKQKHLAFNRCANWYICTHGRKRISLCVHVAMDVIAKCRLQIRVA